MKRMVNLRKITLLVLLMRLVGEHGMDVRNFRPSCTAPQSCRAARTLFFFFMAARVIFRAGCSREMQLHEDSFSLKNIYIKGKKKKRAENEEVDKSFFYALCQ